VSHDLRTPLAVMTGAAATLLERPLDEPTRRELLETIALEGERLNRLVANLLDMTRLESGALIPDRQWHSIEELVGATLARLERPLGTRRVTLNVPSDLYAPLDEVLIGQALFNLVDNAIRHTPPGTSVDIAARRDGAELVIEVADRGPGLAEGDEGRVFEKFWSARGAGRAPGAGLGLAICRGFVEAHGGHVRAFNRPGGGAAFEIRLPIVGEPPGDAPVVREEAS
jgi:two-component system sensor histidine kinase KdpD